jgi:hypothetical protein
MVDKVLYDGTSSWLPTLTGWGQINVFVLEVKLHVNRTDNFFFLASCGSPFYHLWHEALPAHLSGMIWEILGRKIRVKLHAISPFIIELAVLYLSPPENLMKEAVDVDRNAWATYFRFSWVMWLWFCVQDRDRLVLQAWNWTWVHFNEY